MKMPKIPSLFKSRAPRRLNAATVARHAAELDEYGGEPQTRFSVALGIVAMLHVVAVGGIYAFNTIKANRKTAELADQQVSPKPAPVTGSVPTHVVSGTGPAQSRPAVASSGVSKIDVAPGKPVAVPVAGTPPAASPVPLGGMRVHHVKAGETVAKLAAVYGVGVEEIEEANGSKAVAILRPGQSVNIPRKGVAKKTEDALGGVALVKPGGRTYVVAKGDNPVAIAKKFGVRSEELLRLNGIEDPKRLRIGQTLQVPEKKK